MKARNSKSMVGETNLQDTYDVRELSLMVRRKARGRKSESRSSIEQYEESMALANQAVATEPLQPNSLIREAQALNARGIYYANSELSEQSLGGNNLERARNNFRTAAKLSTRAVELLDAKPAPTGDADLARLKVLKLEALHTRATSVRLLVQFGDLTQSAVAESAYQEYIAAETDPVKRLRSRRELATMFLNLNSLEQAKIQFEKILAENPNDPISLAGMGVTLFRLSKLKANQGDENASKANHEAALQYLDRYLKVAPRGILLDRETAMTLNEMNNRRRGAMRPRSARP
jgi:tetratricopeptide (TPR) repeat protein